MSCIRLDAITVDTDNSTLIIENGYVNITDTSISSNSITGSLVLDGGLGINCTIDAISSTNGGALTVGGGTSINGKMYLGSDLTLDSTISTIYVNGIIYPRFFLDTINNKSLEISLDGLNQHFILNNNSLTIGITSASTSITSAAMILNGGFSINCTSDAISITNGGSLTIGGGCSISKNMYVGQSIYISEGNIYTNTIDSTQTGDSNLNIKTNILNVTSSNNITFVTTTYNINDTVTINTTSSSFNNSLYLNNTTANRSLTAEGNVMLNCTTNSSNNTSGGCLTVMGGASINKDVIIGGNIYTNNTLYFNNNNGNNTLSNLSVTSSGTYFNSENGITLNTNSVNITNGLLILNEYSLVSSTNGSLDITNLTSVNNHINFHTTHDDGFNDNYLFIHGFNQSALKIGYNSYDENYYVSVQNTSGSIRDLIFDNTFGNLTLTTIGSIKISSTQTSINSTTGSLVLNGGLSINNDSNATNETCGGAVTIAGGLSVNKDTYIAGDLYLTGTNPDTPSKSFTTLFTSLPLNITNNSTSASNIVNIGCNTTNGNTISLHLFTLSSDSNSNYQNLQINGSNTSGYTLSSNAGGTASLQFLNLQTGNNNNQVFLATNGNVGINISNPAYTLDINGNLHSNNTISGSDLSISNKITCGSLLVSSNSTLIGDITAGGNIYSYQTIQIYNTTNATSCSDGTLNLLGGAGILKDVYIGGSLHCTSSGSFSNITVNSTSGTCLTLTGGLLINNTTNSTNVSNGNAMTILGGASILKDIYIGGNSYFNNSINIVNANEFLNIYDSFNILRFGLNYNGNLSFSRYNASGVNIENIITLNNTTGNTTFNNTTSSLNSSTGSVVLLGGLCINSTTNASNVSNGGSLTVAGGASLASDLYVGGNIHIMSTTISDMSGNGALIVRGGAGITGNVNVGGNVTVTGNLIVNGSTTNVDTINTTITDNIMVLNSGPSGSHDAGFIIQRYQIDNDNGSGDVVTDDPYVIDILTSQSGIASPSNQIKLSYLTSVIDEYYTNWWIKVETGFSSNQSRQIISYNGTTHIATLNSAWTTQNPASGDTIYLYNKPYVGIIYNELLNVFQFGSTTIDPGQNNVAFTDSIGISFNTGNCTNTTPSTNITTGGLLLAGGLSINCTTNATSSTNGGGFTLSGGGAIQKSLYIGDSLYVNNVNLTPNSYDIFKSITYNALNNQLDIPFITINKDVWSFDIFLAAKIVMTDPIDNLYCNFTIHGVNKSSSWEIITNYIGDDTGIEFNISTENVTNNGLIEYSTPDYGIQISSVTFKYRIFTN